MNSMAIYHTLKLILMMIVIATFFLAFYIETRKKK